MAPSVAPSVARSMARFSIVLTSIRRALHFLLATLVLAALLFLCLDRIFPLNLAKINDSSLAVLDNEGQMLAALLAKDERWRFRVKLEEVDPLFIKMLIAYEDKRFFKHKGVDVLALCRATAQFFKKREIVSGASTITMQTARLLEPRSRSFLNKCKEIFRAWQLEWHFSKPEILEFYLMLAPYGGNIEGIRAASKVYFGKEPKQLTAAEAAMLVVLPQSPNRLRIKQKQNEGVNKKNRDKVLLRMAGEKILSEQQIKEAMEDSVSWQVQSLPRNALHLAYGFAHVQKKEQKHEYGKKHEKEQGNQQTIFPTTLDAGLQVQIENLLKQEIPFLSNTQSIAVLVVKNSSREIQAYAGAVDFLDSARKGQIDMVRAIRSPGSLLKPFIYAMGFDDGIIHPETIIQDVPTGFSGYSPSNFKDIFHGAVTIREALKQSLNIPAVAVLDRIGPSRFYAFLRNFGVTLKFEHRDELPSLPLALGGVGMTLWDLVSLYTAFPNGGEYRPLRIFKNDTQNTQTGNFDILNDKFSDICSAESANLITNILQEALAPDGFVDRSVIQQKQIAYKTGTSYGYRDAWAIGYNDEYTVGVWLGKADGSSSAPNTGRSAAAPVLFKVFDVLPSTSMTSPENMNKYKNKGLGKIQASNISKALPRHLQEFKTKTAKQKENPESSFCICFPKEGSVIHLEQEQEQAPEQAQEQENESKATAKFRPITITLSGGVAPYFFYVNGHPMITNIHKKEIQWRPETKGFVELTVVDSQGNSSSSHLAFF